MLTHPIVKISSPVHMLGAVVFVNHTQKAKRGAQLLVLFNNVHHWEREINSLISKGHILGRKWLVTGLLLPQPSLVQS